jgi:PAS domain S-box-containing protein
MERHAPVNEPASSRRLPSRWRLRELWSPRLTALLFASVLLLGAISLLAARNLATLKAGNSWVIHTERVRFEIGHVLQLLTDVETGIRGYALSRDQQFLDPYHAAVTLLPQALSNLKQMIADNPVQRANEAGLENREQDCIAYAQGVVRQIESGDINGARSIISSGEGKRRMDAARDVAAQMQAEEVRLFERRRVGSDEALHSTRLVLGATGALAVILLLVTAYSAVRYGARLRRGEKTLATTLRSIGDAVISTDSVGAVQFMNAVAERLTGWDQQSARGRGLDEVFRIVNEQTRATVENPATKVLREGAIVGLANHTVLIARDGTERPIEDSGAPIVDEETPVGVVVVFRDATPERTAQRALLESERRYRGAANQFTDLADNVSQLVWMAEPDGSIFWYNKRWYEYTGTTLDAMQGWGWQVVYDPQELPKMLERWQRAIASGVPFEMVFPLKGADGEFRPFLTRVVPVKDEAGKVTRWFGTHTDISERLRTEEGLRKTGAELREADQQKDIFLATLAHELRNPLAPIRNAARVLESDALKPADVQRSRLIIARQVRRMASLLDDLLDMSRITRGVFALKKQYVNLQGLLAEAVETARPLIDAKRHTLKLEWPTHPIEVEADPVRFVQIVSNLLTNAAKYTDPQGRITCGVRVEEKTIVIFVRDTGVGLAPEMLNRVFAMFAQVQPNQKRTEGGLGIGLALVKGLVVLHGGRIEVRSEGLGRGSEFIVILPDLRVATGTLQRALVGDRDGAAARTARRVLIADDNRDGAESLAMILELSGHEVLTAHTGPEAFQMAAQHRPHVAILDIGMPGLSGYEVAQQIRREAWGVNITLIAVTGWGQEDDKRQAQRAGFDHHLTKPVDPVMLEELLAPT